MHERLLPLDPCLCHGPPLVTVVELSNLLAKVLHHIPILVEGVLLFYGFSPNPGMMFGARSPIQRFERRYLLGDDHVRCYDLLLAAQDALVQGMGETK